MEERVECFDPHLAEETKPLRERENRRAQNVSTLDE